jgi:hypothetical protein
MRGERVRRVAVGWERPMTTLALPHVSMGISSKLGNIQLLPHGVQSLAYKVNRNLRAKSCIWHGNPATEAGNTL